MPSISQSVSQSVSQSDSQSAREQAFQPAAPFQLPFPFPFPAYGLAHASPAALQSGLAAQANLLNELTRRGCEAMRRFSELHLQFAQQAVQDASDAARLLIACADPFQLVIAAARGAQPAARHWQHYQQQLARIWAQTQPAAQPTVTAGAAEASEPPEQRYRGGETLAPPPVPGLVPDPVSMRGNGHWLAGS